MLWFRLQNTYFSVVVRSAQFHVNMAAYFSCMRNPFIIENLSVHVAAWTYQTTTLSCTKHAFIYEQKTQKAHNLHKVLASRISIACKSCIELLTCILSCCEKSALTLFMRRAHTWTRFHKMLECSFKCNFKTLRYLYCLSNWCDIKDCLCWREKTYVALMQMPLLH